MIIVLIIELVIIVVLTALLLWLYTKYECVKIKYNAFVKVEFGKLDLRQDHQFFLKELRGILECYRKYMERQYDNLKDHSPDHQ
jgi:hypothetical protein